ncbi:DASH complex, subunit Dad4 [Metschnikowia bicuspidata]|uniref:DASH complex subunit DAD4 n=1 Tax=Metschnikowia bicuspidata TaxID=27322 RepID=A0A4P9Z935_9ASCO|nr:DASH complex, subunit Dad4 [Metschnikowia bicuspidata]
MENPHEKVQAALFARIINNMKNLNEAVHDVNVTLNDISNNNKDTEVLAQMWLIYTKSAEYNMEATGQRREPL